MAGPDKVRLTRRDMLKLGAGGAGTFMIGAGGLAIPRGFAGGGSGGGGSVYIEAFPTSPLILNPFNDPLNVPSALRPADISNWGKPGSSDSLGGKPDRDIQDSLGKSPNNDYFNRYGQTLGTHQIWPGEGPTAGHLKPDPIVYQIKLTVAGHKFTTSPV